MVTNSATPPEREHGAAQEPRRDDTLAGTEGETACRSCGSIAVHRQETGQGGPHRRRLICVDCNAHIKWLPTTSPEIREVHRQEGIRKWMATQAPSEAQLIKLRALRYRGPQPASKLEAHDAIDALLAQERRP